jgi:myb proto-oncogene protein
MKAAVRAHDGKNWPAISRLVPGRTEKQCLNKRNRSFKRSIDRTPARTCNWTSDEVPRLKNAVQTHDGKNWDAIVRLVPGRTEKQCLGRWRDGLDPRADRTPARTCKWTSDEGSKLKAAVQTNDGKNWDAVAHLVQGRTRSQCSARWRDVLKRRIDQLTGPSGIWTLDKGTKLKNAMQLHGGKECKDWFAIAALIPGRMTSQRQSRWHNPLWTEDEDDELKDAVQLHGGTKWVALSKAPALGQDRPFS